MADVEDREKAEKVAAARKRYEQLKKQKAKKGGAKSEKDKSKTKEAAEPSKDAEEDTKLSEEAPAEETPANDEEVSKDELSKDEALPKSSDATNDASTAKDDKTRPSLSEQSRMRSESFRRSGITSTPSPSSDLKSPSLPPLSADGDAVQDIYRKQASRIEALEKEHKRLEKDLDTKSKALSKTETELEDLREQQDGLGDLQTRAKKGEESAAELEKLKAEITALQRQNTQLQSAASAHKRRSTSTTSPTHTYTPTDDLTTQLATKQSTIESLELEISNLRHTLNTAESRASDLDSRVSTAESDAHAAQQQLSDLKTSLSAQSSNTADAASEQKNAETRLALLTSDLAAAQKTAADSTARALALEKKVDALTTLHRESEARHLAQGKSRLSELEKARKEAGDLRRRLASTSNENARLRSSSQGQTATSPPAPARHRKSIDGDSGGVEDLEAEELAGLHAKVRALETENFDLRRGVFQRRKSQLDTANGGGGFGGLLSPSGNGGGTFTDVDLSDNANGRSGSTAGGGGAFGLARNMFNTITGGDTARPQSQYSSHAPLLTPQNEKHPEAEENDDDFAFDESAFRVAQEEEAKARVERVREVKRGLEQWRGWRVDLVDVRGGVGAGVFEV